MEWENFDQVRARLSAEWGALPPTADVISASLRAKMARVGAELRGEAAA
jgi:hypothetical protein